MDNITNLTTINTIEEFIDAATNAKKNNVNAIWTINPDLLREIMLGDTLEKIYGDPA